MMPPPSLGRAEAMERSVGRVTLAFKSRAAATVIAHMHQAGCGKVRLPRPADAHHAEAVLINLAGGLTGGDRLEWRVAWQPDTAATVSGQAAEKIYRAVGKSVATIETRLDVDANALALWLPQETILFDRARFVRRNRFWVARHGRLLAVEASILGRRAMGETVIAGRFDESFEVHYADRLVLAEHQRFRGRIADLMAHPAVARGNTAFVSLLYVGENAAARLDAIRDALGEAPAAVSAPDPNIVVVRWLAVEPVGLRARLVAALFALQDAMGMPRRSLPRVWSC